MSPKTPPEGIDPYNTARMRALPAPTPVTQEQRQVAEDMLVGWDLSLEDDQGSTFTVDSSGNPVR